MMLLAMLCCLTGARAKATISVTVGELEDEDKGSGIPFGESSQNYFFLQQIYKASEIGTSGDIISITLWLKGNAHNPEFPFDIYMKETDREKYTWSDNDLESMSDADMVYSTEGQDFTDTEWKAYTFQLSHPFSYSGKRNLIITFNKKAEPNSYIIIKGKDFFTNAWEAAGIYTDEAIDPGNPPSILVRSSAKNVIMFDLLPSAPESLEADVTYNRATLTWTGGTGKYNVQYRGQEDKEWRDETTTPTTGTTWTLYSLEEKTYYEARVQSVHESGAVSNWTTISFTTPLQYPTPTEMTCTKVTANSATLSWKENGTSTRWMVNLYDEDGYLIRSTNVTNNPTTTLTGLTAETWYCAKVRAYNGNEWSNITYFQPTTKWVVGYGEDTDEDLPANYYLSEQIYTVAELGEAATIESIDFCYGVWEDWTYDEERARSMKKASKGLTCNLNIYMVSTSMSSFANTSEVLNYSESDIVFSGEVFFPYNNWTTIPLDTPFEYDGENNMAIIVKNNMTGRKYYFPANFAFRVFEAPKQTRAISDDGFLVKDVKNQIRLVKSAYPLVPKPKNFTLSSLSPRAARVKWTGKADSYDVRYGEIPKYAWLQYDNGTNCNSVYTDKTMEAKSRTWGVMYPGDMVTGNKLAKVSIYESYSYNNNTITMEIYAGGDNAPDGKPIYTQDIVTEAKNGFHEVKLNQDVYITPGQNLWITLTQYGTAVGQCSCLNELEPNSQWVYANGTWQQYSQLYPEYSNYGFMIRAAMEGVKTFPTAWTNETSTDYKEYYMSFLSFDTSYLVQVRSKKWIDGNAEYSDWATLTFTTPSIYDAPSDLFITDITRTTAKLSWTGYQDTYTIGLHAPQQPKKSVFKQAGADIHPTEEMTEYTIDLGQYKGQTGAIAIRHYHSGEGFVTVDDVMLTDANGDVVMAEDFDSGIPNNWFNISGFRDSEKWYSSIPPKSRSTSNKYKVETYAFSSSWNNSDHWLIIPNVALGGTLTIKARGSSEPVPFARGASATAKQDEDIQTIGIFVTTNTDFILYEIDTTIPNVPYSPYTLTDLEPGAYYLARVQGHLSWGYDVDWSYPIYFTTQSFIQGDVNGDGSVTPADAIMILYEYFNVNQTGFIQEAADVNGDGNISPADAIEALYIYFGAGSGKTRETEPAPVSAPEPE